MHQTTLISTIIVLVLLVGTFMKLKGGGVNSEELGGAASYLVGKPAPELQEGFWINSSPKKISDYRGKVVLLEFWTYGCYNCRNTIPTINVWQKKYAGKEFVIVGVHTPEFDREKKLSNVRKEIEKLQIGYAVVTDNNYKTWKSYHQEYWPTIYLIDKKGIIRDINIGEGNYDKTEQLIKLLIAES